MQLKLLNHQFKIINEKKHKIVGLVAGYGSGKSYIMARKAIMLMLANPGFDGAMTEPTYSLITEILLPEMHKALLEFGIDYVYKAGEGIFYCQVWDIEDGIYKETRIITKSMENYERLIGLNLAWVCADEIDTSRAELGYNAYIKLLGRIRVGNLRQFCMFSTPEGWKTLYRIFVEEDGDEKILIRARSTDNPYLPQDFIDTMREQYSDELIEAYINGEFTNLTSGSVYTKFDRIDNNTSMEDDGRSDVLVGMDFNIQKMSAVIATYRDNKLYIYDEFDGYYDTPSLIDAIKEKYPGRNIIVYPDASGSNRGSQSGDTTNHALLRAAGFKLRVNNTNPGILDRVNTVNAGFKNSLNEKRLFVNVNVCTNAVKGLEQNAYDPKTNLPEKGARDFHLGDSIGYLVVGLMPIRARAIKLQNMHKNNYKPHSNR